MRVASAADAVKPDAPPANESPASTDVMPAASASAGGSSEGSAVDADMDGQITAQVRTLVANLAPGGNIDVKATSGVVALTGSVPSQDVADQARQAAQQVAGVKEVDTSALLVANR